MRRTNDKINKGANKSIKQYIYNMKRIFFALSLSVFFTACDNNTEKKGNNNATDIAAGIEPMIQGTWVMTDYITDLQKTKSPLASSVKLDGLVSLDIDTRDHTGDSSSVAASFNNHEGYAFYIYFRKGKENNSLPTSHTDDDGSTYELGYEVTNNDTLLVMYHYGKDEKLIDKRNYTRWKDPVADYDEPAGLQRTANKILFAGKYKATDETGKTTDWEFTNGGILLGVEGHNTYYIFTDFIAEEEGYKIDELCFDEHTKKQKPFIFSIKGDTTYLYQAKENKERTKLEQGPLKYTLIKQ